MVSLDVKTPIYPRDSKKFHTILFEIDKKKIRSLIKFILNYKIFHKSNSAIISIN